MMRVIIALARKDMVLLLRDTMSMFFVLVFPILFGLFLGVVFSGISQSPPEMDIGIIDEDRSAYSQLFTQKMIEIHGARPSQVTQAEGDDLVRTGQMNGYIRIPKGFGQKAGKILSDPAKVYLKVDPSNYAGDDRLKAVVYQVMLALANERLRSAPLGELLGFEALPQLRKLSTDRIEQGQAKVAPAEASQKPAATSTSQKQLTINDVKRIMASHGLSQQEQQIILAEARKEGASPAELAIVLAQHGLVDIDKPAGKASAVQPPLTKSEPSVLPAGVIEITPEPDWQEGNPHLDADGDGYRQVSLVEIEVLRPEDRGGLDQWDALVIGAASPFEISFPLAMIWGVIGCVASFAASLVREKERGTYLRLRSAPIRPWQILAGKAVAMFISVVLILTILVLLGKLVGVRVPDPLKLAVVIAIVAYCFVGVMMLLSIFGKTERAVDSAAWAILLLLTMFGGGMVPIEFLPIWMQYIGSVSPVKWGVSAIEGAMWRQFSYRDLRTSLMLLFAAGTSCLAIGCWIFQRPEQG